MVELASYYRLIGQKFDEELIRRLNDHEHIALLGPSHGGKAIVLERIQRCVDALPEVDRPKVVRLIWTEARRCSEQEFVEYIARKLGIECSAHVRAGTRPSAAIHDILCQAALTHGRPIWILTQNILGIPKPLVRELLSAFQSIYAEARMRDLFGVVVTGSADLIPLTYGSTSPYRHAQKFIVAGLDREAALDFFSECRTRVCGHPAGDQSNISEWIGIDDDAFDLLYEQTGGRAHLIQMLVGSVAHHAYNSQQSEMDAPWTRDTTKGWIDAFVEISMPYDHFCRSQFREAERRNESFDLLLRVLREGDQEVCLPPAKRQHPLEVTGVLVCDRQGRVSISSPMLRRFMVSNLTERAIADVYVFQNRWDRAWKQYAELNYSLPERPVSSQSQYRLREVLLRWESRLFQVAYEGVDNVIDHFLQGMRHLFNFEVGGLYSKDGKWMPNAVFRPEHEEMPSVRHQPPDVQPMNMLSECKLDQARLRLWYDVGVESILPRRESPMLYLERRRPGTEMDTGEHAVIAGVLRNFSTAYDTALGIQYRKSIWELREKYLKVIRMAHKLLLQDPFDLGELVRATTKEIVTTAGYYRVLICLIDPKRTQVQAVSSWCSDREMDFAEFPKLLKSFDIPGDDASEEERAKLDVQAWVVAKNKTAVITDATIAGQLDPMVQTDLAESLGMKAIAVVPMRIGREVVGTIHVERMDRGEPSEDEISLLENLAEEMAVIFRQAQRLDLLQTSIDAFDDEVKIIDPNKCVLYLNPKAADREKNEIGWQSGDDQCTCKRKDDCPIPDIEPGEPVRHYLSPELNDGRACDWQMAVIEDFRNELKPPFKADGTIGYVETVHDLTHLYWILDTAQRALKSSKLRETAEQILAGYHQQGYGRCRIYLVGRDGSDRTMLYSYAQRGLRKPENTAKFEKGEIKFYQDDPGNQQPWLIFDADDSHDPVIYRLVSDPGKAGSSEPSSSSGFGIRYVSSIPYCEELEKEDVTEWIEAPLFVGEEPVGKISLDTVTSPNPRQRELLRVLVQISALALEHAIGAEQERELETIRRAAETAKDILHSFRTPLSSIRFLISAYQQGLASGKLSAKQAEDIIDQLSAEIRRMQVVSEEYKRHVREYHPDISVQDAIDVLRRVCEVADVQEKSKSVIFKTDLQSAMIETDFGVLAENVDELTYNAFKAGATEVVVTVSISNDKRMLMVVVEDNGPGIPDSVKPVLFAADMNKSADGTGFGLYRANMTVSALGGTVELDTSVPRGTRFVLSIPTAQQPAGGED